MFTHQRLEHRTPLEPAGSLAIHHFGGVVVVPEKTFSSRTMLVRRGWFGLWTVLLLCQRNHVQCDPLTPPYFNLAEGKNITATATCGVDTEGPELYCKLIGANADNEININVIQGQFCDECDTTKTDKMHPPEFAVDGLETWWQSPPLSRGMKYNEVNLTIDLGQEFHVAYVFIKMANSPRPGLWVLEKSADYGKTYTPWQYFSDSPEECYERFGVDSRIGITRDDSVICTTEFSKILPLEGGEIPITLLKKRPSANHYFNSTVLQEWTRATNVRLRFLRTKNLLGHLMSVARQDPTVTRRYFYSIKDISIGGRCMCNGHAQTCDIPDPNNARALLCRCVHNTCGAKCNSCCPGFEQKAWRQSKHNDPFKCEPCNCFGHSTECEYDPEVDKKRLSLDIFNKYEGGGVCKNCQHNTQGINCNECMPKFYRPYNKHLNETDVCQPCRCDKFFSTGNCADGTGHCECRKEFTPPDCASCSFGYYDYPTCKACECFLNGTQGPVCSITDGQCPCLYNFGGQYCKECASKFYDFPECKPCECDLSGSLSDTCDQITGNCTCKSNFNGQHCDKCTNGYFNYPTCQYCDCGVNGTKEEICDKTTGQCICKEGYSGERCDTCILGYYGYPDCKPCNCSKVGSHGSSCSATGKCSCLSNFSGKTCNQCSPGYYSYPECTSCDCNTHGSNGVSCDAEGKCECHKNFVGQVCDSCREGYYNFPACEDCNCHPAGVVTGFAGCGSVPVGQLCQCKDRVEGRICDKCKPLFWNLSPQNPAGCEECNCNPAGILGGIKVCESETGQCVCKPSVIARSCSECIDSTFNLNENNLFGCTDCDCDVGGSINNICDKKTGQCICQTRVHGRTCKEPIQAHYFPTLYQYQYEVEDGKTPEFNQVRYGFDETVFKNYSWKGYAIFTILQKEISQRILINKPSLYRVVLRFVNRNANTIFGSMTVTPDNPTDTEQTLKVKFKPSQDPAFVTVSGEEGKTLSPFIMNPGWWTVTIKVPVIHENVYVDYFVLLPEDFYSATILNQRVEKPCTLKTSSLCRDFAYPNIDFFDKTNGVGGFIQTGQTTEQLREFFQDEDHLKRLQVESHVPLLNHAQPEVTFNITVQKPGPYVILIDYLTSLNDDNSYKSDAIIFNNGMETGKLNFYSCHYTKLCRQIITNDQGGIGVYHSNKNYLTVKMKGQDSNVGIHSIYAIPYQEWSLDYINPKPICIRKNGSCITTQYPHSPDSKKIQFEQEVHGELEKNRPPVRETNDTSYIWLNPQENSVDLKGKVSVPEYYTFILQYYQPDFPELQLDVIIQNGQFYEAKVKVQHCPTAIGCRAVIEQADGNNKFLLKENFMVTIKNSDNKNVYLDYLLVMEADLYNNRYLEEGDLDRTGEFISTCGNNHFYIDTEKDGFCRDSVFSITANHNSGARPCECDFGGSLSFECEKFGGQCECKPNIIGRQCKACKTGYYGFPDCKPCNCLSTAYCDATTGQCLCPSHVIGERCDQCEPLSYGYDPSFGCVECKCNSLGIVNNMFQCDMNNGSCSCKANVIGRTCDSCVAGHYAFPYCESCRCDTRGTTEDICDAETAQCHCKNNVKGDNCGQCHDGNYNLQADNPDGCNECYCFRKTSTCRSSSLIKTQINSLLGWNIVSINSTGKLQVTNLNLSIETVDSSIGVDFSSYNAAQVPAYFAAPEEYLGKSLVSYGGYIAYKLFYVTGLNGSAVSGPDIILEGDNSYLTHTSVEQPPPSQDYYTSLHLVEDKFETPLGVPARREHIMKVLNNLKGVYLRSTYWSQSITSRLFNVTMDSARNPEPHEYDIPISQIAMSVEQCDCPEGFEGMSCEDCSPGFYEISGTCKPCECNGHAELCDENGVCLNCTDHTRGNNCELCELGYHGNAYAGTPRDCLICACPLPIPSNNFATACDVTPDGEKIRCECEEGYTGVRCQSCAPGYYGVPEMPGDYCKPCQCSGNINSSDPTSCDSVTGECKNCLNHTSGSACEMCQKGYFGDAVGLKNCQACICDELGTDHCDNFSGRCICKPNVVGDKCDRCEFQHYRFSSGKGCIPCDCAEASESNQCEDETGQCKCKPGITGRSCDRCAGGYWNYTNDGCVSCGCNTEYALGFGCNALTGQCECLPGVIGEKCDECPLRWAFVPEEGCRECNTCVHSLLDDTDSLHVSLNPHINYFDSAQSGYFTRRRLDNMREALENLQPKFDDVDPQHVNLDNLIEELDGLEQDLNNLNRKSNYTLERSELVRNQSDIHKTTAESLLDDILNANELANKVIDTIDEITFELNDEGPEIDSAVNEAKQILEEIKNHNFTNKEIDATKALQRVNGLLRNVTKLTEPSFELQDEVNYVKEKFLHSFNEKLDDLNNHTQYSQNIAREAENFMKKSGKDDLKNKLDNVDNTILNATSVLKDSEKTLENVPKLLEESRGMLKLLSNTPTSLDSKNQKFNDTLNNNEEDLQVIKETKPNVEAHAGNLSNRAQELDRLVSESKIGSNDAVKAARAYQDILDAVNDARKAVENAENNTKEASEILNGVSNKSNDELQIVSGLLSDSDELNRLIKNLKFNLNNSTNQYLPIKNNHSDNEVLLKDIEKRLEGVHLKSSDSAYTSAAQNADRASSTISNVEEESKSAFTSLPQHIEQAQSLPKDLENMKRNILQTEKQLNSINEKLPPITERLDTFPKQQENINNLMDSIKSNIDKLTQQIDLARDIASYIKVGVKFYPNTTLELRNPPNIEDLTTSTKISGYFKTANPKGLIWYLGNPNDTSQRRTKTTDYMALVIQNGYPVLNLDLGNGNEPIVVDKYVADNKWYQFIVERTGDHAELTIREELKDGKEKLTKNDKKLDGHLTIFNLDKDKSKLFVGGVPVNYELQDSVNLPNSFEGEMEDFVIGNTPISLWNFVNGYENQRGATERDQLVVLQPSTGFRFNGNGYVLIDARDRQFRFKSALQLSFKTYAPQGLLFLAGEQKTFTSLEIMNGKILYKYNLGGETKLWVTENGKIYNDGKWHTVLAQRDGPQGSFTVDGEIISDKTRTISGGTLEQVSTISFGGYRNHNFSDVTRIHFDGCIDNVTIMGEAIDLRNNIFAYDVTPGCPSKISQMVSFAKERPGYVGWNISLSNDFKLNLKFKTKEKDGLIFYATDDDQTTGISLALTNGNLKLISQKMELVSKATFNDSKWHVVSVIHNDDILRIDFDDLGYKVADKPPQLRYLYAKLYVGGVPQYIVPEPGTVGSQVPFSGCIADLTVKGNVKDFANTTSKSNEILEKCIIDVVSKEIIPDVHRIPDLSPIGSNAPGPKDPEVVTKKPKDKGAPSRGDGGLDFINSKDTMKTPKKELPEIPIGRPPPTTPKPVKEGCALPLVPSPETSNAYQFGMQENTHLEYLTARGRFKKHFDFALTFKTFDIDGLLFFVTNEHLKQYVALYLLNGYVVFTVQGEKKPTSVRSAITYNDNTWHYVEFSRTDSHLKLVIDGVSNDAQNHEKGTSLNIKSPFYIGGLKADDASLVYDTLNITAPFNGCIKKEILMNGKSMEQPKDYGVRPCSDNVERGTFFGGGLKTYVKLKDKFKVGTLFNIKMEIKPRVLSGVLLAVFGKKDYLVLELVNGVMNLIVENGHGPITSSYRPPTNYYFCDGNWHSIHAVKSKNVVTLAVDNIFSDPKIGDRHATSADTGSALILGGHRLIQRIRGSMSKTPYVGCIRNISIGNIPVTLTNDMVEGNVTVGLCYTN